MRKSLLIAAVGLVLLSFSGAWAMQPMHTKVLPYSLEYPLTRNVPYPSPKGDPYEYTFGVRRWLNPIQHSDSAEFKATLEATQHWNNLYGGYGVIGHGEDVFTNWAANYRRHHRGK
jgi:hypothetical protein